MVLIWGNWVDILQAVIQFFDFTMTWMGIYQQVLIFNLKKRQSFGSAFFT